MKNNLTRKKLLSLLTINIFTVAFSSLTSLAQTGPAGVGNTSNNHVWLDARTMNLAEGIFVDQWVDISGNENHFEQATATKLPIYRESSGIAGIPSLQFDGVNDCLFRNSIAALENDSLTYFIVLDRIGTTADMIINAEHESDGVNSYPGKWRSYWNNGQDLLYNAHYSPTIKHARYADSGDPTFISNHIIPSRLRAYRQGILKFTRNATYTTPTTNINVSIGDRELLLGSTYSFNGYISEVIIYNSALNNLERILIENYLGAKYQMSVVTDLYAYDATHRFGLIALGDDGEGHIQSEAKGFYELTISDPTDLESDEYFVVAHTGERFTEYNGDNVPVVIDDYVRLERHWKVDEDGDVGTVELEFDLRENDYAFDTSYRLLIDDDGDFSDATVLAGTYVGGLEPTVTFSVNLNDGDYFTLSGIQDIKDIHSVIDGVWSDTLTWDCHCIPSTQDSVTIDPFTTVTVDENGFTDYLKIDENGTLIFDANFEVDVDLDFDIAGDLIMTDGTITLSGEFAQDVNVAATADTVKFYNLTLFNTSPDDLTFNNGTILLSGRMLPYRGNIVIDPACDFIIASTSATDGGRVGIISSPTVISGDITVQRYLPGGLADWRGLASPVIGATFNQWDPDIAMSGPGFPDGCAYDDSCFRSVIYMERSINYPILSVDSNIVNTYGYELFLGDDLDVYTSATISSKGALNTYFDIPKTMQTGWWMVGNPYASPIEYNGIAKTSAISKYYYVYSPVSGSYEWYDQVTGTSSIPEITASGIIATGQSFWIRASSTGTMTFKQSDKTNSTATFILGAEDVTPTLNIKLSENASTYFCTMVLEEFNDATDDLDTLLDILHPNIGLGREKAPSFAMLSDTSLIRKNFIKKDGKEKAFDLVADVKNEGFYTISAENWANFRNYHKIILIDPVTGESVNLKEANYTFYAEGSEETTDPEAMLFKLILTNRVDGLSDEGITVVSEDEEDGLINLVQMGHIVNADSEIDYTQPTTVKLVNTVGQEIVFSTTIDIVNGSNIINLPSSLKGFYILTLTTGNDVVTKKIIL
jgi:hypothetical protein